MKRRIYAVISAALALVIAFGFSGCKKKKIEEIAAQNDPVENIAANMQQLNAEEKTSDNDFISSQASFGVSLFKNCGAYKQNTMVSPLSVMLAMCITANGADGETKKQMEKVLGNGITVDEMNKYLYSYVKNLTSDDDTLKTANSVWLNGSADSFTVNRDFLQVCSDYYSAEVYKSPFDNNTLKQINNWVEKNTDGNIKKILERINEHAVSYIINTVCFENEWQEKYDIYQVSKDDFTNAEGKTDKVEMLNSSESVYIEDEYAKGIIKDYKGGKYRFAAMLPNSGVTLEQYISSLDGAKLLKTLENQKNKTVFTQLPKFKYQYAAELGDVLIKMGMTDAFNQNSADFSKLGKSEQGKVYVDKVVHSTYIELCENGTKAGAVTAVSLDSKALAPDEVIEICFNRPFVYFIIDSETNLPVFMGTVTDIQQ